MEMQAWSSSPLTRLRCIGQYANAVLRFEIDFPGDYPERPPVVTFLSDVFHPLVTPLTTYTYTTRDTGGETVSAADQDRLPPGVLSLRHGFPEWFDAPKRGRSNKELDSAHMNHDQQHTTAADHAQATKQPPLTVEILQYLRIVFDTEVVLDTIPLEMAANTGAWHAWRSYRSKILGGRASPATNLPGTGSDTTSERSTSPRQQPGGARRPAEWNWQGVWDDRVKKSIQTSISEQALYSGEPNDVMCFSKMDADAVNQAPSPWRENAVT